ncbi:glycine betaine ABC transporter substrate-binding protein [Anaeromyxobacter paludicola]|uniref:Amino acid ABC transporter permease n=1 Tax=Anaeromyxobacter paludicola TaxID=2918171 RepID=A0ABN6NBI3_9BACT|nr:glycine betaine ABC transporter substrate-binding protein [Anaeromyxobacter paludicola]BDG10599.1 amino acid ABC transporter permease [Anaeromyxobacter paludicola]
MSALAAALSLLLAAIPAVRVGSKKFTESVLLGDLAAGLVAGAGARAETVRELGGTRVLWEALRRGELDLYPEYTGTLAREILGADRPLDLDALRDRLAPLGAGLTGPLGFEDTYAVGMRADRAEALGIRTLSDLARHPELRLGFTSEFLDRADGWPALRDRYGIRARPRGLDHDVAYRAVAQGELDAIDLYSTDPEIAAYGLRVLEDDRRAFPEYQAVLVYRLDLARRAPAALAAVRRLDGRLGAAEMIRLNGRVQLAGEPSEAVAAAWLRQAFGAAAPVRAEGLLGRVARRTGEHLLLVLTALAAAVAAGVPLGVVSARRAAVGRAVLGAAGLVQTVPSLALLVFLLPLLGIGARPAVAALFLYGLLPIVRGTHAGLAGIAPELRESAEALGLPPRARLRLVELPLALPSILAGVRTAAVIAVGTATLGALIGAGGYGQPILSGLRLASVPLILEGAVPAALLALLVEAGFEGLERAVVPRGLRRR